MRCSSSVIQQFGMLWITWIDKQISTINIVFPLNIQCILIFCLSYYYLKLCVIPLFQKKTKYCLNWCILRWVYTWFMEIKSNECVSDLNLWDDEVIISVQLRNKLDRHNRAYWPHDSYKTEFDLLIRNNSAINYNRNLIWLNDWLADCCLSEHELYYTDKCM